MIIYVATNLINNKKYVGKTKKSLSRRKHQHQSSATRMAYDCVFHKALLKYGFDNFKWEMVDRVMFEESLSELEKYYIKKFNTRVPCGYNLTGGGEGLYNPSDQTRKKISDIHKIISSGSRNPMYGKKHTEEAKKKQSIAATGRKNPSVSERNRKLVGEKHPSFGKKRPDLSLRNKLRSKGI